MRSSLLLLLLWSAALGSLAQPILPSSNARVSLLTIAPGDELYSTFGHSAFRISDPQRGVDYVYNYGTFDFNTPGFYTQFAMGQLPYMLSISHMQPNLQAAVADGRSVIEQELALTMAQKQRLITFLHTNYLPENRFYPYDFFMDNCATRLRDALEKALGDSLKWQAAPPKISFRQMLDAYLASSPFSDFGIDLLLGRPADALADHRQVMFLPDYLQRAVAEAEVRSSDRWVPLARHTQVLYQGPQLAHSDAGSGPLWPSCLLAVLGAVLAVLQLRGQLLGLNVYFDRMLMLAIGVLGCVLFFETFIAVHKSMKGNLNLLWAWPTHLVAALAWRRRWVRHYALAAAIAALLVLPVGLLGVQGMHPVATVLALLLAVRWGLRWRSA